MALTPCIMRIKNPSHFPLAFNPFSPRSAFSFFALWTTPLSVLCVARCPTLVFNPPLIRLIRLIRVRFFFFLPVGYASVCSVRCPLPYSRF